MPLEYFSLPLQLDAVMQKREHPRCSLPQSVEQNLHLILVTAFGEMAADEAFGCAIWEHDFDNITSSHKLKEIIRQSLVQAVTGHEGRLGNVRVELLLRQEELPLMSGSHQIKKHIDVTITGTLLLTAERFRYNDAFFISPLSY